MPTPIKQWQTDMGEGKWSTVDKVWNKAIFDACQSGCSELHLPHWWQNKMGKWKKDMHTIDLSNPRNITQRNDNSGTVRKLQPIQIMETRYMRHRPALEDQPAAHSPTGEPPAAHSLTDDGVTAGEPPAAHGPTDDGVTAGEPPAAHSPTDDGVTAGEPPAVHSPADQGVTEEQPLPQAELQVAE